MRTGVGRVCGSVLIALVGGCGGGAASSSGWLPPRDNTSIPVESLSAAYVSALCEFGVRCGIADSQHGCELGMQLVLAPPALVASVHAGKVAYDPQQAGRCIQLIKQAPCVAGFKIIYQPIVQTACHNAFIGTVAAGGACTQNRECQSESCQVAPCASGTCCVGACSTSAAPPRDLPIGAACTATSECAEGTYCSSRADCRPMVPVGQPCELGAICRWDSACLPSATGMYMCAGYAAIGESCNGALCSAPGTPIAFCELSQMICTASTYSDIGGPCNLERPCVHGWCDDIGVCRPTAALGASCTGTGALPCEQGLWAAQAIDCDNGVCTRPPLPPDPCDPP
jgi:hypothetical protein